MKSESSCNCIVLSMFNLDLSELRVLAYTILSLIFVFSGILKHQNKRNITYNMNTRAKALSVSTSGFRGGGPYGSGPMIFLYPKCLKFPHFFGLLCSRHMLKQHFNRVKTCKNLYFQHQHFQ